MGKQTIISVSDYFIFIFFRWKIERNHCQKCLPTTNPPGKCLEATPPTWPCRRRIPAPLTLTSIFMICRNRIVGHPYIFPVGKAGGPSNARAQKKTFSVNIKLGLGSILTSEPWKNKIKPCQIPHNLDNLVFYAGSGAVSAAAPGSSSSTQRPTSPSSRWAEWQWG